MSKFTFITQALGYDDEPNNSNPLLSGINRRISVNNIPVDAPQTLKFNNLAPGATQVVFNGNRSLNVDNTTTFNLTLSTLSPTTYRLSSTGGTAPGFRTSRTVNINGVALGFAVGANLAVTVTAGTGTPFTGIQVGDTVFIPGVSTGDSAGPFNTLNEGFWTVLTGGTNSIIISRSPSSVFSGINETITPSDNTQFQVFSSDNVQIGDTLNLTAGFAASALHAYEITNVTAGWVEFTSTLPLGNQTGIAPTASGISIFVSAKRWIYIETDQELVYQINGDTGQFNHITPILAGDPNLKGTWHAWAAVWQLSTINKSTQPANVTIYTVE